MMRKIVSSLAVAFAVLGWLSLTVWGVISPLPLGAVPPAIMALLQVSTLYGIAGICLFLGMLLGFIICLVRGSKNSIKVAISLILLDVALSIFFLLVSSLHCIGIIIDFAIVIKLGLNRTK